MHRSTLVWVSLVAALIHLAAPAFGAEDGGGDPSGLQQSWSELLTARPELLRDATEARALSAAAARRAEAATADLVWIRAELDAARSRLVVAVDLRDREVGERNVAARRLARAEDGLQRSRDTLGSHAATIYKHGPSALGPIEVLLRSGSPGDYVLHHRLSQAVLEEDGVAVDRADAARDRAADGLRKAETEAAIATRLWEEASDDVRALVELVADQRGHQRVAEGAARLRRYDAARAESAASGNADALGRLEARIGEVDDERRPALTERRAAVEDQIRAELADDYPFLERPRTRRRPPSLPPILGYRCPLEGASFTNDWAFPRPGGRSHEGTDLFADRHAPILAVAAGQVMQVDIHDNHGHGSVTGDLGGRSVSVRTPEGERWYYAHLETMADGIEVGVSVEAGQQLGTNGDSGNARGGAPHLHLGRYWQDAAVNPYPSLAIACR